MNQLVDIAQLLLRSLKAFHGGNDLLLLSINLLLHIGNLSFQMPYSQEDVLSEYHSAVIAAKHRTPLSLEVGGVKELRRTQFKRR